MSSVSTQTKMAEIQAKSSMKSTWRYDKSKWGPFHYALNLLGILQEDKDPQRKPPVVPKTEKVRHIPQWTMHRHVLLNTLAPLALHQAYFYYTGNNLSWIAAGIYYVISFQLVGIHLLHQLRELGYQYGFLDGDKHPRDGIPDQSVSQVFWSLINTATWRSVMFLMFTYDSTKPPSAANWLIMPLEQALYGPILDFWFYWYHRVMHENDYLWQFHRTHHLTKHPNALLTLYADTVQELFDIAGIPFLTWGTMKLMGFPMGFYEWWVCTHYVVFAELSGHSGLRAHAQPPSFSSGILKYFNCELIIEDHDLHHRRGYKKSGNYGKQTRLWDTIFGTLIPRIECTPEAIDYENPIHHPIL